MNPLLLASGCLITLATAAFAQTEGDDGPSDAPSAVVITQPPATKLDALDRQPGMTVRGLTQVADLPDERGGSLAVYAVTIDDRQHPPLRGLAISITQTGRGAARAYIDEEEIEPLIEAVKTLAKLDRGATPMADSRGVYRTRGNVSVLNVDANGGRVAIVRTLQVSPLTGQVTWAAARFRATRLTEIARQLQAAKDVLDKSKTPQK